MVIQQLSIPLLQVCRNERPMSLTAVSLPFMANSTSGANATSPTKMSPPLRVLFAQRDRCVHEATATGKRINNIITRFGLIVGHNGSVVRDRKIHAIVEDQISDDPTSMEGLCPILIPLDVCLVLRNEYENFGQLTAQAAEYKAKIFDIARSMQWETDTGSLPGDEKFGI